MGKEIQQESKSILRPAFEVHIQVYISEKSTMI